MKFSSGFFAIICAISFHSVQAIADEGIPRGVFCGEKLKIMPFLAGSPLLQIPNALIYFFS